ncbi:hypothetical protein PFFCH_02437 [Plasmodium falciparum FCH/4]|uniref:WD repeat-containing protein n=1 Tax=Plasmodium falciparum FCH/4 TaxID=1036724 RepID=A0A024VQD9_PLAFA|nr:hypothetical protein PFFCH_02437 [Plasmodium falciparum FCH/4]
MLDHINEDSNNIVLDLNNNIEHTNSIEYNNILYKRKKKKYIKNISINKLFQFHYNKLENIVTSIDTNKFYKDYISSSYSNTLDIGSFQNSKGNIAIFSFINPNYPLKLYNVNCSVMKIKYSKNNPNLLVSALSNGHIYIYDIRQKDETPVLKSTTIKNYYENCYEPIYDLSFKNQYTNNNSFENIFYSAHENGSVYQWNIEKELKTKEILYLKNKKNDLYQDLSSVFVNKNLVNKPFNSSLTCIDIDYYMHHDEDFIISNIEKNDSSEFNKNENNPYVQVNENKNIQQKKDLIKKSQNKLNHKTTPLEKDNYNNYISKEEELLNHYKNITKNIIDKKIKPTHSYYYIGTKNGIIYRCNSCYQKSYLNYYIAHFGAVNRIKINKFDHDIFISAGEDCTVKLWNRFRNTQITTFKSKNAFSSINDIIWSPNNSTSFFCCSDDGRIELWDFDFFSKDPLIIFYPNNLEASKITTLKSQLLHKRFVKYRNKKLKKIMDEYGDSLNINERVILKKNMWVQVVDKNVADNKQTTIIPKSFYKSRKNNTSLFNTLFMTKNISRTFSNKSRTMRTKNRYKNMKTMKFLTSSFSEDEYLIKSIIKKKKEENDIPEEDPYEEDNSRGIPWIINNKKKKLNKSNFIFLIKQIEKCIVQNIYVYQQMIYKNIHLNYLRQVENYDVKMFDGENYDALTNPNINYKKKKILIKIKIKTNMKKLYEKVINNIHNNDKNYNKVISDNKDIYDIHCETNDSIVVDKKRDMHDKNNKENCDINKKNLNNNITDIKLSDDDKETKDDANEKYNKGDYEGALKIWERGLRSINYVLSKRDELNPERLEAFLKMHTTYCSNIAQGYMKINKYSECVKYSLLAQENDKNNIKIYFRLAKGYFMLGEYDKSIKVLNEGIKINKDTSLINLLKLVLKKKQTHLEKEKHMMKHIFQNLKQKPLINDDNNTKSFFFYISSSLKFLFIFIYALFMKIYNLVLGTIMDKFCKIHKR